MRLVYSVEEISLLGKQYNYEVTGYQDKIGLLSLVRGAVKVQVYLSRMTVGIVATRGKVRSMKYYKRVDTVELEGLLVRGT